MVVSWGNVPKLQSEYEPNVSVSKTNPLDMWLISASYIREQNELAKNAVRMRNRKHGQ